MIDLKTFSVMFEVVCDMSCSHYSGESATGN